MIRQGRERTEQPAYSDSRVEPCLGSAVRRRSQAGFTLIELLVVVSILAILMGVTVFAVGNARDNARANACTSEKFAYEVASDAAKMENDDIRDYIRTDPGLYFQASGLNSFDRNPTSPLDINCE